MLKKVAFFVSLSLLVLVIIYCFHIQSESCVDTIRFCVKAENGVTQKISLYEDKGKYYAFLPSYADLRECTVEYGTFGKVFIDNRKCSSGSLCSEYKENTEYPFIVRSFLNTKVTEGTLIIMKGGETATLNISLTDGTVSDINKNKEIGKTGLASLITPDKKLDYHGNIKEIHGRGNTTWKQKKKSYSLELPKETALLGMNKGKNWVLLSNSFDESGLRNKLAYETAKKIGVKYPVDCKYVDLYINEEYYGLYLLSEHIEAGENHVDINDLNDATQKVNQAPLSSYPSFNNVNGKKTKRGFEISNNPDDITGGYLIQTTYHKSQYENELTLFNTDSMILALSSPKYASKEQIDYITKFFEETEKKIINGDLSSIDLDSFVKYYLIQEYFANTDDSSYFYCKDSDSFDGKLYACSIWDFDLSLGNSWLVPDMNPQFLYSNKTNWYGKLYKNEEFRKKLKEEYINVLKPALDSTIDTQIEECKKEISASFLMNKARWRNVSGKGKEADKSQLHFKTLDEHINYISDFMNKRTEFLDSIWIDEEEYNTVFFSTYKNTDYRRGYSVKKGEVFNELPSPESKATKEYEFLGWYDENGNKYVPGRVIEKNERYTARWKKIS